MGQFSWIYSDTNKQLIDNKRADTYLLVPKPFQEKYGKEIYEGCYDGIDCELRWLGIVMACYDEDNAALEYPIKITTREMEYEKVAPSLSDPNQGWESDDDEDEEWW